MAHDRFGPRGILKQQALKTKDETILLSRLDTKKLEAFLGGQMGAQALMKLQLEVDKNKRMANGEDVQDIDELLNAGFINQQLAAAVKKGRKVLQTDEQLVEWDEKQMDHHQRELQNFGEKLQIRYVEHWINEVLTECEELKVPGILVAPEQKKPLFRYEVNRQQLVSLGLANEGVDHVYRTLYTHSVGLFNTLREVTKHMREGRAVVLSNIWRIYQILLEHASKNDYKLITQKMTEQYVKDKAELNDQIDALNKSIIQKDIALQEKIQKLNQDYDKLEQDQLRFENERQKLFDELKKSQQRLEEEVNLRLFFENKLNQLHAVNNHAESNAKLLFDQRSTLITEISQLKKDNLQIIQENVQYKKVKEHLADKYTAASQEAQILKEVSGNQSSTIGGLRSTLALKQKVNDHVCKQLVEAKQEILVKDQEEVRMKMTVMNSTSFVESLKQLHAEQKRQNLDLEQRIVELNQKVKDAQILLDKETAECQSVSAENELNKKRLDHAMLKITQLTKTEEGWETKCQALEAKYEHLDKANNINKQQIAYSNERIDELEQTRNQLKDELQKYLMKSTNLEKDKKVLKALYTKCKQENVKIWVEHNDLNDELEVAENERDTFKTKCNEFRQSDITSSETLKQRQVLMEENLQNHMKKSKEAQYQKTYLAQRNKELEQQMIDWKHKLVQNNTRIQFLERELNDQRKLHQSLVEKFYTKINADDLATDTYSLTEQVKYLNFRNKEETQIYQEKIDKMKSSFDRLGMQIEDADARALRSEEKLQVKMQEKTKLEAELKFVGRRYVACLVTRHISNTRIARQKSEMKRLNELIKNHDKFMIENQLQLQMLGQLKENMKKLKKDQEEDPVEILVDLMKGNQINSNKLEKKDQVISELEREINRLKEQYENMILYEKPVQTEPVEFLTAEIKMQIRTMEIENGQLGVLKESSDTSKFRSSPHHKHHHHDHSNPQAAFKAQKLKGLSLQQKEASATTSLESGTLGILAGRESEKEQQLQKQRAEEATKQADIKKKLKTFMGVKLMKANNRRTTVDNQNIANEGVRLRKLGSVVQIGEAQTAQSPYRPIQQQLLEPDAGIRPELEKLPGRGAKGSSSISASHPDIADHGENIAQQKVQTLTQSPKKPAPVEMPTVIVANLVKQATAKDQTLDHQEIATEPKLEKQLSKIQRQDTRGQKESKQQTQNITEKGLLSSENKTAVVTHLDRANHIITGLLKGELEGLHEQSSSAAESTVRDDARGKTGTFVEEPTIADRAGVGALTNSKSTIAEREIIQIERSSSCQSHGESESATLDNDIFIEYVRNCHHSKVAELMQLLNQEPVVNQCLGACPKCHQKQSNKFFVRIKPNNDLHLAPEAVLMTKPTATQNSDFFKKQLQRLFQNRSSSPMLSILASGKSRNGDNFVNRNKSLQNNTKTAKMAQNYHSTINPRSQSDLKQHNYNIDDFLKHYQNRTIEVSQSRPQTQSNFYKKSDNMLMATVTGGFTLHSSDQLPVMQARVPRAQTQNQKKRIPTRQNLLNSRNAADDMSINMWNASPSALVPAGAESQLGTSQTNISSVKGMAVRQLLHQGHVPVSINSRNGKPLHHHTLDPASKTYNMARTAGYEL